MRSSSLIGFNTKNAMPAEILAWVQDFVTRHHVDVPCKKRKNRRREEEDQGRRPPRAAGERGMS